MRPDPPPGWLSEVPCKDVAPTIGGLPIEACPAAARTHPGRTTSPRGTVSPSDCKPRGSEAPESPLSPHLAHSLDPSLPRNPAPPQACIGFGVRLVVKMVYGGLEVGSLDEAARCLERAIELQPERLVHRVVYARILLKQNKKEAAIEQLDAAVAMNVEDINAKLERAEAFRMRDKLGLPPVPASLIKQPGAGPPAPLVPSVPAAVAQRISSASSASTASCGSAGSGGGGGGVVTFATPLVAAGAS